MKKGFCNKAQFFLLAAVIISAVAISLGVTYNFAKVSDDPIGFYDLTHEVKRETGAVIDYEVYNDFDDDANLTDFVALLSADILDKDEDANFMFVYGDKDDGLTLRNYGSDNVTTNGTKIFGGGSSVKSKTYIFPMGWVDIEQRLDDFYLDNVTGFIPPANLTNVILDIGGQNYTFPISEHRQVIFIIKKEVANESYIALE